MDAGASDTRLIQEPVAAAIGAGLDIRSPGGSIVVDVGGGTTDIALVSLNSPVLIDSVRCAGNKVDESIVRFMKKKHNVLIGERTAEQIKMQIGIVSPEPPVGTMDVTGRNLVSGLPTTVHIHGRGDLRRRGGAGHPDPGSHPFRVGAHAPGAGLGHF